MKKLSLIVGAAFVLTLSGCVQVSGTKTADGSLKVSTHRFFWASEGIDFSVKDEKGFSTGLKVSKSTVDAAAISAVAEGFAKGVVAGATKP